MMNEEVYQNIYDEIDKYLSGSWEKLVVYLEYGSDSYLFSFYIRMEGKYLKCYDLPNVSDDELAVSFRKIDKAVSKERNSLKEPWSNMTLVVENSGKMHADMDYTDLSEGTYKFKKEWKKKYLI